MPDSTPTSSPHARFWSQLQRAQDGVLRTVVPPRTAVVLLDIPIYFNIGDLMILLGTERWMARNDLAVVGRWSCHDFSFPELPEYVTILLQGGGNFGDLYPFQKFREQVVATYSRHRIVFLPQTLFYENESAQQAAGRLLGAHANLHIFVRDTRSLTELEAMLPGRGLLAPDMCVQLFPWTASVGRPRGPRATQTLYLLRRDVERLAQQVVPDLGPGWEGDWKELLGPRIWKARLLKTWHLRLTGACPSQWFAGRWAAAAGGLVSHCADRFSAAGRVVTSRLHGHLLASLLGIPNIVLDNTYGKNSDYFRTWHTGLPDARLADTLQEAETAT